MGLGLLGLFAVIFGGIAGAGTYNNYSIRPKTKMVLRLLFVGPNLLVTLGVLCMFIGAGKVLF